MNWYVVGTMTGLRCEQHPYEPDNSLSGPYKTGEIAVKAMKGMLRRDRIERVAAWILMAVLAVAVVVTIVMTGG